MGRFVFGREEEGDNSHLGGKATGDDVFANASEGDGENLHLGESGRTICICERAGVGRFVFGREGEEGKRRKKGLSLGVEGWRGEGGNRT